LTTIDLLFPSIKEMAEIMHQRQLPQAALRDRTWVVMLVNNYGCVEGLVDLERAKKAQ
jgi:hypothetical protein